jgi:hypothetical protein
MASRRGRRRSEYLDLAYSRAAFSAERGAANDGQGGGNLATATLGGTAEGGATTTAAGLAVAVLVTVAVAVVVAVAVAAVVVLLGEKTVLVGGAPSERRVCAKCSVHSLTECLCVGIVSTLSSLLHTNTHTHYLIAIIHYLIAKIHYYTLLYTIIHYYTLLYTIIHYYTLLYTIIHYYTL